VVRRFVSAAVVTAIFLASVPAARAGEASASKSARALSAGPPSVTAHATVIFIDDDGKIATLRPGSNGWTCGVGTKGEVGADPFCTDAAGMQWTMDWMMHKSHPTNTKPGIMYMFAGGRDWSATDPWATKGTPIVEPPHWMLIYPFNPKTSGLPSGVKMTGTWIMWSGTPYAHLMINQKP